jgi:hypothetical protein
VVLLNGVTVIVKAAHVRLCHSRMLFVRCYPRETQEIVARQSGWEHSDNQDGHFGGRGERMIVAARR